MGDFGSDSTTKQTNIIPNNSVTISDQAVYNRDQRRNVGNINLRGKSQIIQNYGADADELAKIREQFADLSETITSSGADSPAQEAAQERAAEQITAGGELAKQEIKGSLGLGNWVLIGLGLLALLGLGGFVLLRKAKA